LEHDPNGPDDGAACGPARMRAARRVGAPVALSFRTMHRIASLLALACLALASPLPAAGPVEPGKFLVASRQLQGPAFAEAVILVVHYDETGAMGLIVNRPTRLTPERALPRLRELAAYQGPMYHGGPVARRRVMALLRSDQPPADAARIIGAVHIALLNTALLAKPVPGPQNFRLYMGYTGWGPGQLDAELARGSWHVVDASEELVFADDSESVWRRLLPAPTYQVALDPLIAQELGYDPVEEAAAEGRRHDGIVRQRQ